MILKVKNNICVLESDKLGGGIQDRAFLLNYCTAWEKQKKKVYDRYKGTVNKWVQEPIPLYKPSISNNKPCYVFPRGLFDILDDTIKSCITIENNSSQHIHVPESITLDEIKTSLQPMSGFDLRVDQVSSVYKALKLRRGVIQLPTGGGKTEVMASTIKILKENNPDIKVLVIEPTDILTVKTAARFNNYNLDATTYKDSRKEITHSVTVAHVMSLLNDLNENPDLLKNINAVFWDECHHLQSDTWLQLNSSLANVEYALGMSALAVDERNLYERNLKVLSLGESLIIGATGPVIMYVPPKYYISEGILATPVVFQVNNKLINLDKEDDWHKLRKLGICSDDRTKVTADVTNMFHKYGRRVLILVGTKDQAFDISNKLCELGLYDRIGVSFGGRVSYIYEHDETNDTYSNVSYKGDIVATFDKGDLDILLSTSHLDEGVDISNLDVCILASGGKKDRRIIQRIGRALRKTKTGKYAYIIDFSDKGNPILEYHSRLRMALYKDLIEVPPDLVHCDISLEDMSNRFKLLEDIKEE